MTGPLPPSHRERDRGASTPPSRPTRRSRLRALLPVVALLLAAETSLLADTTWTGAVSTNWFTSGNWSNGIPDDNDDTTIPNGLTNYPVLTANGAEVDDLIIQSGATLDLGSYTLEIHDDLTIATSTSITSTATGALRFISFSEENDSEIQGALSFAGDIIVDMNDDADFVLTAAVTMNDLTILDGEAELTTFSGLYTTTVTGNVSISSGATLDRVNGTLDVAGNFTITGTYDNTDSDGGTYIGGNWTDTGTHSIGTQTVTFDGGGTSTISVPDSSDFYNITITNGTTAVVSSAIDINGTLLIQTGSIFDVDGDLDVTGGATTLSGTGRLKIGSTTTSFGTFTAGTGTVEYDGTAANQTIRTATYYNLEIDKGSFTATANSTFTVTNDLTVTAGTLDIVSTGDVTVTGTVVVDGTLRLSSGSDLRLNTSLTVRSGGTFAASGATNPLLTNDGSGDYTFTVESGGTIDVSSLTMSNVESTGMTLNSGAVIANLRGIDFTNIDPDNDGSNDTFLRILETSTVYYAFVDVSFDSSTTYNVSTPSGSGVDIRMILPSGAKGTEAYENEGVAGAIDWPQFTRAWVGGTSGFLTQWDTATNWSPAAVPTQTDDCYIPDVTWDPILNTTGYAATIYVDTGGSLTINANHTMNLAGDLILHELATFSMTNGTLEFDGSGEQFIDDQGDDPVTVYDLTVNGASAILQSSVDLTISDDLTVTAGTAQVGTFTWTVADAVDIDDTLLISSGTLDGNGAFDATGGDVTFSGAGRLRLSGAVTSLGTFTANASTVEYDGTAADRTVLAASYHHLEIDTGTRTASAGGNFTVGGDLVVTSGTFAVGTTTVTVTGGADVNGTLTVSTGTLDANGAFDATGGAVTFTGAGRLQLGGAVTSLGTFTASTSTVEYDGTSADQAVIAATYHDLEIDNGTRVALTAGNVTVSDDLTITAGELEVDDSDVLRVDDDVSVAGRLDLEPGSSLLLAAATSLTVTGTFEAVGTSNDLVLITSSDTATPGRYSFAISAGGVIDADHVYFRYMNSSGIQVTDNGSVTALTRLRAAYFDNGAAGGVLLSVTNNDNAVTLPWLYFVDTNSNLAYNVRTTSATAAITIDPYGGGFGGSANEDDNGSGTVDPGFIIWAAQTPVSLVSFAATETPQGILLEWETAAEWRLHGYQIERAPVGGTAFVPVGPRIVLASGVAPGGDRYRHLDGGAPAGVPHRYRLIEVDIAGGRSTLAETVAVPAAAAHLSPPGTAGRPGAAAPALRAAPSPAAPGVTATASAQGLASTSSAPAVVVHPSAHGADRLLVSVAEAGITRIDRDLLASLGFPVGASPDRFLLERDREPWPIHVLGGEDGRFDPGDAIDFLAVPFEHPECRHDIYRLSIAPPGASPPRIPVDSAAPGRGPAHVGNSPAELVIEEDSIYAISLAEGAGRDHWFGGILHAPGSLEVPVDLPLLATVSGTVTVEIALEGWTSDVLDPLDHWTAVLWNGVPLGELEGAGPGPYGGRFTLPRGAVIAGANVLRLEGIDLGTPGVSLLDLVRVSYRRLDRAEGDRARVRPGGGPDARIDGFASSAIDLYQVEGPGAPRRLRGFRTDFDGAVYSVRFATGARGGSFEAFASGAARAPAALRASVGEVADAASPIDLIVIAPVEFADELEPLLDLHRSHHLGVFFAPLEEVYERFSGGRATTDGIRDFLRHAHANWPGGPFASVLLVGDATYDPRGNAGPSPRQVLPTRLIEAESIQTASDPWFADLVGDDGIPEIAIGRLPVATSAECQAVVEKIVLHATSPALCSPPRIALVRDDAEFAGTSEGLVPLVPSPVQPVLLDLDGMPISDLRQVLFDIEWKCASVVHYIGHGSRTTWGAEPILGPADVMALPGVLRPPIVTSMSCLNGFFQLPGGPSLGESLLLAPGTGAVAYFGPTAVSSHLRQQALAEELVPRLLDGSATTLGEAIRAALLATDPRPEMAEIRRTWVLLGDPALPLR